MTSHQMLFFVVVFYGLMLVGWSCYVNDGLTSIMLVTWEVCHGLVTSPILA